VIITMPTIEQEYAARHPRSQALFAQARQVIAGGITHDSRHLDPFPIYVTHGKGSHKWDVDGLEYVDYFGGHGALLLGHGQPDVVAAVQAEAAKLTHPGACTELEVTWARQVQSMVPSAERVKFVASGTEATLLAMRVARASTGKTKVLRFRGHFHGWHDAVMIGYKPPYDVPASAGVPAILGTTMLQADCNDLDEVRRLLETDGDVAAVILEPGGGQNGAVPNKPGFLEGLRQVTKEKSVVLIFDEVISGFRFAPGGAQQRFGVIPDMSTLGKIVAGGLPGGAVTGKASIMDVLDWHGQDPRWERFRHVLHQGTFNANPLTAVAGITLLRLVADGKAQIQAEAVTKRLVDGFNEAIVRRGLPGCAYYGASVWHVLPNVACPYRDGCNKVDCSMDAATLLAGMGKAQGAFRVSMFNQGVDTRTAGWVSAVHTGADIEATVRAFDATLVSMQAEGLL
jgi:glutamate-1-semialdehyde 2,1-aminomutase